MTLASAVGRQVHHDATKLPTGIGPIVDWQFREEWRNDIANGAAGHHEWQDQEVQPFFYSSGGDRGSFLPMYAPLPTPPLIREITSPPSPHEALLRFRGARGLVLLESAGEAGRFSLLAAEPVRTLPEVGDDPFRALEDALEWAGGGAPAEGFAFPEKGLPFPGEVKGLPFPGGIIGYLGYEAGDRLERLPRPPDDDLGVPEAWFGVYEWAVCWEKETGRCRLGGTLLPGEDAGRLSRTLDEVEARLRDGEPVRSASPRGLPNLEPSDPEGRLDTGSPTRSPSDSGGRFEPGRSLDREGFMAGVERIRSYIRAGDLFQANLTRRLSLQTELDGIGLFLKLVSESPAPFAAYLDVGEAEVASISPELFLSLRGRAVETHPIKGTAPRSPDAAEDRRLAEGLAASLKDRAENVMIVDLLRNDLSRVCEDDSVEVPRLVEVESHPTVHHLVSTVVGRLRPGSGPVDLIRATFPGGSITGAPKIRAMEVLRELEPARRGVYTGAIGVLGFHGDMELSVAIRTAVVMDGWAHYGTGGGITLASDPASEWNESEDKAAAFRRAVAGGGAGPAASEET